MQLLERVRRVAANITWRPESSTQITDMWRECARRANGSDPLVAAERVAAFERTERTVVE